MRDKFLTSLHAWLCKPARFWEFWLPRSGLFGGILAGSLLVTLIYLFAIS